MNITYTPPLEKGYTEEEIMQTVAIFRGGWTSDSEDTVEEVFERVMLEAIKNIVKDAYSSKGLKEVREQVDSDFE